MKKSLERNLDIPVSRILVESIEKIEVLDKYRLKIVQKNSPSILIHNLAHSSTAIVKEIKTDSDIDLIGTGAYKIKDWSLSERISLESFDKYYEKTPKIKEIIFKLFQKVQID